MAKSKFNDQDFIDCSNLKYTMSKETVAKWHEVRKKCTNEYKTKLDGILSRENIEQIVDRHLTQWNKDRLEKNEKYYNAEKFIKVMGTEVGKLIDEEIKATISDALLKSIKEFITYME